MLEFNDTLKISKKRGFPAGLNVDEHQRNPEKSRAFLGAEFSFWNPGQRVYHPFPNRCFLVEELDDGKWVYWGHALVSAKIEADKTIGTYKIIKIYKPEIQRIMTINESRDGKGYFSGERGSFDIG